MFGTRALAEVREFMTPLQHPITPLHRMDALAAELGIAGLLVKDESQRSGLGSFKALGGAYAVIRLVLAEAGREMSKVLPASALHTAEVRRVANCITVTCATDGNHGKSVAAGARLTGCRAVIFVHGGVSDARVPAMRDLGAQVRRVAGTYDDAVAFAAAESKRVGWHLVSDTSWPGHEEVPAQVMQGYLVVADEVLLQCTNVGRRPTHVFLQAGVGGFAATIAVHPALRLDDPLPRFIVVEPESAACLYASAVEHAPTRVAPGEPTVMSMLECFEPSLVAWRILEKLASAFVTIDDQAALRAMRRLAEPLPSDPFVQSGESGGAGLAALIEAAGDQKLRQILGLDLRSVILAFNTEGATDPGRYKELLAAQGLTHAGSIECSGLVR